ncbi:long-chain-fatty-acid--CoA ligase [Flammeovirga aprica]|uniref:Long-chain fatty acid--CoA ligase n=1 Tax=Flammeovirga aprica JL-4 TaxID=694437 RepID=A0A7X9RY79_9BACT|nr:long-chain fatty acid--CoA ligase [Flammeovirga aprica]NME70898.1 long-chain fatty acid--CoA ligase [Flammeovirga aprica JL-4]
MLNLSSIIESSALKFPDQIAFKYRNEEYSFAEINATANKVANALSKLGLKKGDKVALSCVNIPYFPIIYYGILKAGLVVVPLNINLKTEEIIYHLKNSESKVYFCFSGTDEVEMAKMGYEAFKKVDECLEFITIMPSRKSYSFLSFEELIADESTIFETSETHSNDTAVIIYTSGTTGNPKGAELTHFNLLMNSKICKELFHISENDTQLIVLPLFHIFAMTVLMNSGVLSGCCNILVPKFREETILQLFQKHEVTVFAGVPTMYLRLTAYQPSQIDLALISKKLRLCISGGASLPVSAIEEFEQKFNVPIIEGYGMSEGSPVVTFNVNEELRKMGSIGVPVYGVEVKIVDKAGNEVPIGTKGELWYRGHNVMKGYYKNQNATAETITNGWLHSGDIAVKDEDGFYFIVDRAKDIIISGGVNIYPREVEDVIMKHEAVSMVAVIGVPDEIMGENVKAYVVLKNNQKLNEEELIIFLKQKIASYKSPRSIEFLETLPMNATGKILKKKLRKKAILW